MHTDRFHAPSMLVAASLLWSLGGVLIKGVEWHPIAIAGARSLIALPLVCAFSGGVAWKWSGRQWAGAVAYAATVVLFVAATRLTTAANAIFLQYTAPIYVAVLAPVFLGEPSRRSDWIAIGVALCGIILFFMDAFSLAGFWGNVIALASGFSFAAMTLLLRAEKDGSPLQTIVLGNILAAAIGVPFMLTSGAPQGTGWTGIALLGCIQLGLPYVVYGFAIRRVTALQAILVPLLEPILNPLWVMLATGERPGPWAAAGALLVAGAVLARGVLGIRQPRLS